MIVTSSMTITSERLAGACGLAGVGMLSASEAKAPAAMATRGGKFVTFMPESPQMGAESAAYSAMVAESSVIFVQEPLPRRVHHLALQNPAAMPAPWNGVLRI